jgi:outer membrane protein insertion porin family
VQVSFTEPYLFDKNVSLGVDIYRRDYNSFNYMNSNRNTTYKQTTTGFQVRAGVPLTEYMSLIGRYTFNIDDVSLDQSTYYLNGECSPLLAGRYLCDALGHRTSSIFGLSLVGDTLDNRMHPTKGMSWTLSGDVAGPGGSVRYARVTANASRFWAMGHGFVFSLRGEGGAIAPLASRSNDPAIDDVRLTDRFFLGQPQMRGFDIRGVGPRVLRKYYNRNSDGTFGAITTSRNSWSDDALGGRYYYIGHAEMEIRWVRARAKWACVPRSSSTPVQSGAWPSRTPVRAWCSIPMRLPARSRHRPVPRTARPTPLTRSTTKSTSAIRRSRAFRSASASTGTRLSGRSGSTSPRS